MAPVRAPMPASTRTSRSPGARTRNPPSANANMPSESRNCRCGAHCSSVVPLNDVAGAVMTGGRQQVRVDVRKAGVSLRATLVMRLNGGPPPPSWADGNPLVDLYRCRDDRWVHLHGNFPHLAAGTMAVLGCSRDRAEITAAVARRDAQELEDALAANRQCGAMARTAEEWAAHPQG